MVWNAYENTLDLAGRSQNGIEKRSRCRLPGFTQFNALVKSLQDKLKLRPQDDLMFVAGEKSESRLVARHTIGQINHVHSHLGAVQG